MAANTPAEKNLLRMESRRFTNRCDAQMAAIERADALRDVSRLAVSLSLPYALGEDYGARDALRLMQSRAEERARELIVEQLQHYQRAEISHRDKLKHAMFDAWTHLTGPLGHLRPWAMAKLAAAERQFM